APGQTVPAILWASPSALALVVAGAASGRPIAPLGPLLTPGELEAAVRSAGGSVLVADGPSAAVGAAVADASGHRLAVLGPLVEAEPGPASPGEVAVVLHTSGTAGVPKRVDVRHAPLAARTPVVAGLLDLGPGDRYVTAKGIHHIGGLGLTLAALAAGAAVIPLPRYRDEAWAALAPLAPTHGSVVPTMIEDMLGRGRLRLPSMRLLQYGGAPIRPATLAALLAQETALEVVALYGQTEGSPIASLSAADHRRGVADRPDLLRAAGRAAPGVELRIEAGEVLARADHLFRPGPDGWLRTGDLGTLDDGYLFLTGRAGDVIVRGGENVHPLEVEAVLGRHPAVLDVAVAAVPDDRLGQTVGAWVVTADGTLDEAELRSWTRTHLAGFKVPTVWTAVPAIPRNPNGKIQRRDLPMP
ncbi:MAG: class I adenylate-forming enzyme family protein, partial [Acidimicrobiia bacterium]